MNTTCNQFQLLYTFLLLFKNFWKTKIKQKPEIKIKQGKINLTAKKNRFRFHDKHRYTFSINFENASKFKQHATK